VKGFLYRLKDDRYHSIEHGLSLLLLMLVLVLQSACSVTPAGMLPPPLAPPSLPGAVVELQQGTTIKGIMSAIQSQPFTLVMEKTTETGRNVFFGWPQTGGWGFFCAKNIESLEACKDSTSLVKAMVQAGGGRGNWTDVAAYRSFVQWLSDTGWKVAAAGSQIEVAAVSLSSMSTALITIAVFPITPTTLDMVGPQQ